MVAHAEQVAAAERGRPRMAVRGLGWYEPLQSVFVRAPLLPIERYTSLATSPDGSRRAALRAALADPLVGEALTIASPSVERALARARAERVDDRGVERLARTALRYVTRMSTRPTPFGLFAGVTLGGWGSVTSLALCGGVIRHARPDMHWLLAQIHQAPPASSEHDRLVRANPALARAEGRMWIATDRADGSIAWASLRDTPLVELLLAVVATPIARRELHQLLCRATRDDGRQVAAVLDSAARAGLLIPVLAPPLTASDPASAAADLVPAPAIERLRATLVHYERAADPRAAMTVLARARAASEVTGDSDQPVVQVDGELRLCGDRINPLVARETVRAAELLLRLGPGPGATPLDAYRQAFARRFGPDAEVPLPALLHPRLGLGSPYSGAFRSGPAAADGRSGERLLELAQLGLLHGGSIELTERDVEALARWTPDVARAPRSLELYVQVGARSARDVDRGDFTLVVGPNIGAGAAGRNLSRFALGLGDDAVGVLRHAAATEAADEPFTILAELLYMPGHARVPQFEGTRA